MYDAPDTAIADNVGNSFGIGNIKPMEFKFRPPVESRKTRLLQRRIIVIIDVIDANNTLTTFNKTMGDSVTNETGSTGDKNWIFSTHPSFLYKNSSHKIVRDQIITMGPGDIPIPINQALSGKRSCRPGLHNPLNSCSN